jgi:uncharacterized protein YndB with AHSA1/START domain
MSVPGTLVVRRTIPASREEIFDAWLTADSLKQWMCPTGVQSATATIDARVGGRYRIVMHGDRDYDHAGEYLVIDRPSKLSFTWISEGTDRQSSIVTVELFDTGRDGTELVLTHEQLPPGKVAPHVPGWTAIIEKLAASLKRQLHG